MKTAFRRALPRSSIPGSSDTKYWVNATGKTARENHSASRRPQPTMKPGNGPATAFTYA